MDKLGFVHFWPSRFIGSARQVFNFFSHSIAEGAYGCEKKIKEAVAKLACPEKSMILNLVGRASFSWPDCNDEFNLNKLNEELQAHKIQKGDFNGQWSFATASKKMPAILYEDAGKKCTKSRQPS